MKAYKIELLVLAENDHSYESVKIALESNKYLMIHVMGAKFQFIDWHDEHPLNNTNTIQSEYIKMFGI